MRPGGWREIIGRYDRDDFMALVEPSPSRTRKQKEPEKAQQHTLRLSHKSPLGASANAEPILPSADRGEQRIGLSEFGKPEFG